MRVLAFVSLLLIPGTIQAQVLYGAIGRGQSDSDLYIVDPATGNTTAIGPIGFGVTGLAADPLSGELYGVTTSGSGRQLIVIDTATGAGTAIGPLSGPIPDISFSPTGTLFGWTESFDDLVTINTANGATTVVDDSGLNTFGTGLDFNPSGVLYLSATGANGELRTVDTATGLTTVVAFLTGAPAGADATPALAFHPLTGVLYAIVAQSDGGGADLAIINTTTGAITTIGALPDGFDALAWSGAAAVPSMPLPTLLVLAVLTAGVATLLLRRRTRMA